jgi:very-short-patch-repair endonuclease
MGDVLTSAFAPFAAEASSLAPAGAGWALEDLIGDRRLQNLKFFRQAPLGPYVADFFCPVHRLVIDAAAPLAESLYAARREAWLKRQGYKVLKACDWAALAEREAVVAAIAATCGLSW